MSESKDYTWLVGHRSKIQQLLLELYNFVRDNKEAIKAAEENRRRTGFGWLVGAAYSLWRAAFLVDKDRDLEKVLKDAELFLEKLIRDNMIGYRQDYETLNWSVGYYLNNAYFRIGGVLAELPRTQATPTQQEIFKRFDTQDSIHRKNKGLLST